MIRRKILFATDFSKRDRESFHVACRFAKDWDAQLLIVHSDDSLRERPLSPGLDLNQELYKFVPDNVEIDYEHILRVGNPADEIIDIQQNRNVALIVLGTHGRKGIERVFSGSVAERIIRDANCPVMTLREVPQDHTFWDESKRTRILVPVDFSVHSYSALDLAEAMAQTMEAEITILHVDDSRESGDATPEWKQHQKDRWHQLLKYEPENKRVTFSHKLLTGAPAELIPEYINSRHYDYVVLGTHGRAGLSRVLMGSVAEQVVRQTDCPVITVKPSNKRAPVLQTRV